jgi:hypothetical protein
MCSRYFLSFFFCFCNNSWISVTLDTFQIIATLKHFALGWPVSTSSMFSGLGALLINVDLLQLECSLPAVQYQQKWYIMMLSQSHGPHMYRRSLGM